jgi:hypothetical protein
MGLLFIQGKSCTDQDQESKGSWKKVKEEAAHGPSAAQRRVIMLQFLPFFLIHLACPLVSNLFLFDSLCLPFLAFTHHIRGRYLLF